MTLEQISDQAGKRFSDQLDRFESIWLSGEVPDLSRFLRQSKASLPDLRGSLVELDLEYRWKRYRRNASMSEQDSFGFPLFPRLEDYADLLDESERSQILTPELLAEEYRVRRFWGDQPPREQFLERLPQQTRAIEEALNQIDTEFEIEGMTPLEQESAALDDAESTILNHMQPSTSEIKSFTPNIGKYELVDLLGRGGFGEVWRAYDPNLKRHVALKFPRPDRKISPDLMEYFRREAQKMAALEQVPGVVPVYESGESNGVPYIVSFLVEGHNLDVELKTGSLSLEESVQIVTEVATTLHRAHLKSLFHRDVKLSNILVNQEGQAFLSDFGLSVSEEEQLHETHSATGTYAYMSPEQIRAQSHRVDGRTDIYSLGVVLYRLLTKRLPYVAETPAGYIDQVLHREPRPPRSIDDQIPAELERICLKCLSKPISDRYTTAGDLAEDLRAWLAGIQRGSSSQTSHTVEPAQLQKPNSQRRLVPALLVVLTVLVAGLPIWYSVSPGPAPPSPAPVTTESETETDGGNVLELREVNAGLSLTGFWDVREKGNVLRVSSDDLSLRDLGTLQNHEELHLNLKLQEIKISSRLGIFWGLSDPSYNSDDARWQALAIQRDSKDDYRLDIEYHDVTGYSHDTRTLAGAELDLSRNRAEVSLSLDADGLKSLEIDEENLYGLVALYQQEAQRFDFSGHGRWGLSCDFGSGVFTNLVIDDESKTFKLKTESR